jgi:hypothetical protein
MRIAMLEQKNHELRIRRLKVGGLKGCILFFYTVPAIKCVIFDNSKKKSGANETNGELISMLRKEHPLLNRNHLERHSDFTVRKTQV